MKKTYLFPVCLCLLAFLPGYSLGSDESALEFNQAEKKFGAGDYAGAEKDYQQAFEKCRTMIYLAAYIQNRIGECCQYQKKPDAAAEAYRKVQTDYPGTPQAEEAQEKIARVYYEAGDYKKAGPEFEKAAEKYEKQEVSAAAVGKQDETTWDRKNEAWGYSAFCYHKSGNKIKASLVGLKIKERSNSSNKSKN